MQLSNEDAWPITYESILVQVASSLFQFLPAKYLLRLRLLSSVFNSLAIDFILKSKTDLRSSLLDAMALNNAAMEAYISQELLSILYQASDLNLRSKLSAYALYRKKRRNYHPIDSKGMTAAPALFMHFIQFTDDHDLPSVITGLNVMDNAALLTLRLAKQAFWQPSVLLSDIWRNARWLSHPEQEAVTYSELIEKRFEITKVKNIIIASHQLSPKMVRENITSLFSRALPGSGFLSQVIWLLPQMGKRYGKAFVAPYVESILRFLIEDCTHISIKLLNLIVPHLTSGQKQTLIKHALKGNTQMTFQFDTLLTLHQDIMLETWTQIVNKVHDEPECAKHFVPQDGMKMIILYLIGLMRRPDLDPYQDEATQDEATQDEATQDGATEDQWKNVYQNNLLAMLGVTNLTDTQQALLSEVADHYFEATERSILQTAAHFGIELVNLAHVRKLTNALIIYHNQKYADQTPHILDKALPSIGKLFAALTEVQLAQIVEKNVTEEGIIEAMLPIFMTRPVVRQLIMGPWLQQLLQKERYDYLILFAPIMTTDEVAILLPYFVKPHKEYNVRSLAYVRSLAQLLLTLCLSNKIDRAWLKANKDELTQVNVGLNFIVQIMNEPTLEEAKAEESMRIAALQQTFFAHRHTNNCIGAVYPQYTA